ncbi:hypothetical protein NDN08_002533 [Rhodosorus marinus]|uniref:NADH:ubiquinone oxidoreductase intermediate-associated protein 30 domain-containing protein n=1 Tax=Rhodosorus marinus TaxID=101924 RepID=A0AAV8UU24_9RHOD|nr:hypothetical protein NDN08_002533 [Rhodosorus marinus]
MAEAGFVNGTGIYRGVRSGSAGKCVRLAAEGRKPWPVARFLKDFVFFTPIGEMMNPPPKSFQSPGEKGTVIVTGATGGVGKRVVREFLKRGYKVRALVRSEERARKILGADADNVDLLVSDLYNLHEDFFKGATAVVSCTGTMVGPTDDTPDREKYYQGVVFYPPVILQDTPENVEYRGIKELAEKTKLLGGNTTKILSFENVEDAKKMWGIIDDIVMGGVSESNIRIVDGNGVFDGFVSTANNGGFASVRSRTSDKPLQLSPSALGFSLRVKGDGNRFKFIVRTEEKWDGVGFSYSFDTVEDQWIDVQVPFDELTPVFRAKTVDAKFDPRQVRSFQLMLSKFEYDGKLNPNFTAGRFVLEVESISTYSNAPKVVHISTAGVTRVHRKDEFPDLEKEPPAVRMNEMLGRILDWKLAGEDCIRQAGVPYLIVRPCALTEENPSGRLQYSQGDTLKGKVPRDDIAKLAVDAIQFGSKSNITIEVAEGGQVTNYGRALGFEGEDKEQSRTYAEFPYVPK